MSESRKDIVERRTPPGVGHRTGQYESEIPQISCGLLDLSQPTKADNSSDRPVMTGHHEIGTVLGVSDQARDAAFRRLCDAECAGVS